MSPPRSGRMRAKWWVSGVTTLFGLGWFIAGCVGVLRQQVPLIVFGYGLAAFYLVGAWIISPIHSQRVRYMRIYRVQSAIFRRLGIKWLTPPKESLSDDDKHEPF